MLLIPPVLSGCRWLWQGGGNEESRPDARFGEHYVVAMEGDQAPRIEGETLVVTVSYGGGCAEHAFVPRFERPQENALAVWLFHRTPGDPCRAYLTETVRVPLSPQMLTQPRRVLLTPQGQRIPF